MGAHINKEGQFQSDKYPTCPPGKVPLSVKDKTAQDLLWRYAQRRRSVDAEFCADLMTALLEAGYAHSGTVFDEIRAEADAMIARSRRGIAHDDDKTPRKWEESLCGLLSGYEPRRMWVKIAALALRAIESIDRKSGAPR